MNSLDHSLPGQPLQNVQIGRQFSFVHYVSRHWLALLWIVWGVWVALPFLAPVFMHLGWVTPASIIYTFYSFQCHQLPERSFFLFGSKFTYSLPSIQAVFRNTTDPTVLRHFIGNPSFGWKVAWSDRMVSMYSSVLLFIPLYALLRRKVPALPFWGLVLFLLPMGIDGVTHMISDLGGGMAAGFRFNNIWLAQLTHYSFPTDFYTGDAWGSFNSIMRLLTGVLFALGITWFALPRIDPEFNRISSSST